jgi:hypothetical protein
MSWDLIVHIQCAGVDAVAAGFSVVDFGDAGWPLAGFAGSPLGFANGGFALAFAAVWLPLGFAPLEEGTDAFAVSASFWLINSCTAAASSGVRL